MKDTFTENKESQMARPLRIEYEGAFYHVTARGNERKKIFLSKRDHEKFLQYLGEARDKYRFVLHAYVIMGNHYHLIIETPEGNLSRIMHYINSSYLVKKRHRFSNREIGELLGCHSISAATKICQSFERQLEIDSELQKQTKSLEMKLSTF